MTVFSAYNYTKTVLKQAGIEPYIFEAKQIIKFITGYDNRQIMEKYNEPLEFFKEHLLMGIVKQRASHYPLQYILGEWSFYGYNFKVGKGVLCPRSDTETLVDVALELLKEKDEAYVADLCSGSGCIGITLAKEREKTSVLAVEKSEEAYTYLLENIVKNNADNVTPLLSDIDSTDIDIKFDLIVSNPPYISKAEMALINEEARSEPEMALYGGEDGLDFYKIILDKWLPRLKAGGSIAVEVGAGMHTAVIQLFKDAGLENINTRADYNEIQRVVYGTLPNV